MSDDLERSRGDDAALSGHDDAALSVHDDAALSRELTAAIRATEGVTGVYPAQPTIEAAVDAVAVRLALRQPDVLVDIDRADGFTTVSAHIATSAAVPATETLRAVGELIRSTLGEAGPLAINVKVRLIDNTGRPASK